MREASRDTAERQIRANRSSMPVKSNTPLVDVPLTPSLLSRRPLPRPSSLKSHHKYRSCVARHDPRQAWAQQQRRPYASQQAPPLTTTWARMSSPSDSVSTFVDTASTLSSTLTSGFPPCASRFSSETLSEEGTWDMVHLAAFAKRGPYLEKQSSDGRYRAAA